MIIMALSSTFQFNDSPMISCYPKKGIEMEVADDLVLSTPAPSGVPNHTLATMLGLMLYEAESLYGERDRSFTILGVEFFKGVPHIWFPGNRKDVVVRVGVECAQNPLRAYWQLANEIIHLLNPPASTNILEEGVASNFVVHVMKKHWNGWDCTPWFSGQPYDVCRVAVDDVLAVCPDFIRRLRDGGGNWKALSAVTEQDIVAVCPSCPVKTAKFLAAQF